MLASILQQGRQNQVSAQLKTEVSLSSLLWQLVASYYVNIFPSAIFFYLRQKSWTPLAYTHSPLRLAKEAKTTGKKASISLTTMMTLAPYSPAIISYVFALLEFFSRKSPESANLYSTSIFCCQPQDSYRCSRRDMKRSTVVGCKKLCTSALHRISCSAMRGCVLYTPKPRCFH